MAASFFRTEDADSPQRGASDPGASVWVAASAGTGKTKVLIDRVLRLLLDGVAPERILCLTFTKAAAAEMRNRIMKDLRAWAVMDDTQRAREMTDRFGRVATADHDRRARSLFAQVLDAEGGLKIQTIHAFCESLLGRFPLEAEVAPNFSGIDEMEAKALRARAIERVLEIAADARSSLAEALKIVTRHLDETRFQQVLRDATPSRATSLKPHEVEPAIVEADHALRARLGIGLDETEADVRAAACADAAFDAGGLKRAVQALETGSAKDQERARVIAAWLEAAPLTRVGMFDEYCRVFLTKESQPQATLITKNPRLAFPGTDITLGAEAERLAAAIDRQRSAASAEATRALMAVAGHVAAAYRQAKQARAVLDYDDLIVRAIGLLEQHDAAAWVLFKLDGGLDHVLVDEAQDTSPDQWRIIRALTAEFFAGEGARRETRTVFFVGDLKQSIYRFQGADPDAFIESQANFAERVRASGRDWRPIDLDFSFRSTRAVLTAVDRVFAQEAARDGVAVEGQDIVHRAYRLNDGGTVELWPLVEPEDADKPAAWQPPTAEQEAASPQIRLADRLARHIAEMIEGGDRLESEGRPVRPGDIMILVQRRTSGFMADLIHALKRERVPVAGEDRMVLSEQIAVMDLMALAEFCLLPEDNLTLATVLKSPLCGFDEDQLQALAHPRGERQSLWSALRTRAKDDAIHGAATAYLTEALRLADAVSPFDFFARLLGPMGGRQRLLGRLGREADDPLNEFLALALAFERVEAPSLQGFLRWLKSGAVEIKRDQEHGAPEAVRVLTVHGAKGLQAPIVFLPDTVRVPQKGRASVFWENDGDRRRGIWRLSGGNKASLADAIAEAEYANELREYRRLLYVAMTRARDRLIICGWRTKKAASDACWCWYRLIASALDEPLTDLEIQAGLSLETDESTSAARVRLSCPQLSAPKSTPATETITTPEPLPAWARRAAAVEPPSPLALAPSRALEARPPVLSPLDSGDHRRFARGRLIHTLLQYLPAIPAAERQPAAARWLARNGNHIDGVDAEAAMAEVRAILDNPAFAHLFGPDSQAEAPVSGHLDGRLITGQIDRLVVRPDGVDILDYKTDRPPPPTPDAVAPEYKRQMALYRALLAGVYPDRPVRVYLLWTDGPKLMHVPASSLARDTA